MDVLPSLFSCYFSVFLWAAASANTYGRKCCTAGGEETGDGNERTKAMARACCLAPLCFLLFMFFPSARPCCVLLRSFILWFSFPCFPFFSLCIFCLPPSLLFFLFVLPLTRVCLLLRIDGCCCYGWCILTVRKGSEGWCLWGLSVIGRLLREEMVVMVWGRWCECTWVAGLSNNQGC